MPKKKVTYKQNTQGVPFKTHFDFDKNLPASESVTKLIEKEGTADWWQVQADKALGKKPTPQPDLKLKGKFPKMGGGARIQALKAAALGAAVGLAYVKVVKGEGTSAPSKGPSTRRRKKK